MNMKAAGEIIFWLSAAALFYTYVGYPMLIAAVSSLRPRGVKRGDHLRQVISTFFAAVSSLRPRGVKRGDYLPQVSVIITAFNEERALAAKLENTLALDYPRYL